ncbi:MAG TPA: isoprenyl transferase [Tissierellia bacterium]|nr:isoprenyl transferase [Tissierellia bacterium]
MLPKHVAFIMDGNGRWAAERGLERTAGHRAGTENIRGIIRHSKDLGIKYLTFYAFSAENFSRPAEEVGFLMKLIPEFFHREIRELTQEGARIQMIGDISQFSRPIQLVLSQAEKLTKHNDTIILNFALAYGGRQEIVRAVNQLLQSGKIEVTDQDISDALYTSGMPDPDLVIRTSGEQRVSNFLLYQSAYSEFYFTSIYWPDFSVTEFDNALADYQQRKRRFGGL